jgi:hypothetical protein
VKVVVTDEKHNILFKSYDGDNSNSSRYGIKVVPRMV